MPESSGARIGPEPGSARSTGANEGRANTSPTARERARETVRVQLRAVARRHITERGMADLSLRAIARELNMTSSAVYRYVSSRDDLIMSLVVESYESLAQVTEEADRIQAGAGGDAALRWLAISRSVRQWALAHPHDYGLICGWPNTRLLASARREAARLRLWRVLAGVMDTAVTTGVLQPPARPFEVGGLVAGTVLAPVNGQAGQMSDFSVRAMALVSSLIGAISAELFGPFQGLTTDQDRVFDLVLATGAMGVGLELPVDRIDRAAQPDPM